MGNNNRIQDTTCWNGEGHLSVGNRMGGGTVLQPYSNQGNHHFSFDQFVYLVKI
jgi:hypothetical protein